jgi:hypothetical protein
MNKRQPLTLGEVIELLQAIQRKYGSDLVVQVGGKDLERITPVIWQAEEQAANGGDLRDVVLLEGYTAGTDFSY